MADLTALMRAVMLELIQVGGWAGSSAVAKAVWKAHLKAERRAAYWAQMRVGLMVLPKAVQMEHSTVGKSVDQKAGKMGYL